MRHESFTEREPNLALSTSANLTDWTVAYTHLASIPLLLLHSFMFAYEEMRMSYALYSFPHNIPHLFKTSTRFKLCVVFKLQTQDGMLYLFIIGGCISEKIIDWHWLNGRSMNVSHVVTATCSITQALYAFIHILSRYKTN